MRLGSHEEPKLTSDGQHTKKLNELPVCRGRPSEKYWTGKDLGGKVEIRPSVEYRCAAASLS